MRVFTSSLSLRFQVSELKREFTSPCSFVFEFRVKVGGIHVPSSKFYFVFRLREVRHIVA